MKRWLINVSTNWCGEDNTYSAYANTELELADTVEDLAYSNYSDFSGFDAVLNDLFPDVEEYTDEMIDEAAEVEGNYYSGSAEEWDESRSEEEWNWYECVYDGRNIEVEKAEEDYNELDNLSRT